MEMKRLYVKVEYADRDITAQIEPYLENLKYTDNLDGETADTLTVTLDDSQGLFSGPLYPVKGSALYFEFGYDTGDLFKSGKGFLIDSATIEGGGANAAGAPGGNRLVGTVVLEASANLPGKGIHSKATKAWTNTTLEGIAKEISQKHGLDLVFDCGGTIELKRFDQIDTTDLKALNKLTSAYGLMFSIKAGKERPTLVITDLETMLSRPPILKLPMGGVTGFTFKDSVAPNTKGRYGRYFDPVKKELVEFGHERLKGKVKDGLAGAAVDTVDGQGQQDTAVVRESLKAFASKNDPKEAKHTSTITLPGNPNLLAGVVIELAEDEWTRFAGKWLITKSEHDMDTGGYKTKITIKKYNI